MEVPQGGRLTIDPYTPDQHAAWADFVCNNPRAGFGHLPAIFDLEQVSSPHTVNRSILLRDDGGALIGVFPLFEIVSRELRYIKSRELVSGTYLPSGPLLKADLPAKTSAKAFDALATYCVRLGRERRCDRIRVSFPNVIADEPAISQLRYLPLRSYGFHDTNPVSLLLDLGAEELQLFQRLDSGCRNKIRRAEREGATVHQVLDRDEWLSCYPLNVATLGAIAHSRPVLETVWDGFVSNGSAQVHAANFDGAIHAVVVTIHLHSSSYYWFGFNSKSQPAPGINNLTLWRAICAAKARGTRLFQLGSKEFGDSKQRAISAFKESFGGECFCSLSGVLDLAPARRLYIDLAAHCIRSIRRTGADKDAPERAASAAAARTPAVHCDESPARNTLKRADD